MLSPHDVPGVAALEALAPRLYAEALALPASCWVPMPAAGMYEGGWTALLFSAGPWAHEFAGAAPAENLAACPSAQAFLQEHADRVGVFGLLSLAPGARLAPHRDHRADDEVRVHIPVALPAGIGAPWRLHAARLLDIRDLHAAENPGSAPRITVVADLRVGRVVEVGEVPPWEAEAG
jgi:hypothetical protein